MTSVASRTASDGISLEALANSQDSNGKRHLEPNSAGKGQIAPGLYSMSSGAVAGIALNAHASKRVRSSTQDHDSRQPPPPRQPQPPLAYHGREAVPDPLPVPVDAGAPFLMDAQGRLWRRVPAQSQQPLPPQPLFTMAPAAAAPQQMQPPPARISYLSQHTPAAALLGSYAPPLQAEPQRFVHVAAQRTLPVMRAVAATATTAPSPVPAYYLPPVLSVASAPQPEPLYSQYTLPPPPTAAAVPAPLFSYQSLPSLSLPEVRF